MAGAAERRTAIERALDRDRAVVVAAIAIVAGICWAWIVPMARDMSGAMLGPAAWMMTPRWDATHVALLFAMWTAMMAGMMLPSAAPTLLLYANVVRKSAVPHAVRRTYLFAAGYLAVWTAFSAAATALQRLLAAAVVLTPMMQLQSGVVSGVLLVAAGIYQLTPLKQACLGSCRSPVAFITQSWRDGDAGAFRMGVAHGALCLGCCWAMMLLLFAGGVMNLVVIAAIALFVLVEKAAPFGATAGRVAGALLVLAGVAWAAASLASR